MSKLNKLEKLDIKILTLVHTTHNSFTRMDNQFDKLTHRFDSLEHRLIVNETAITKLVDIVKTTNAEINARLDKIIELLKTQRNT
jgi:hypothetical protein